MFDEVNSEDEENEKIQILNIKSDYLEDLEKSVDSEYKNTDWDKEGEEICWIDIDGKIYH